jgi:hypothetical protein
MNAHGKIISKLKESGINYKIYSHKMLLSIEISVKDLKDRRGFRK